MARMGTIATRAEALLGAAVVATTPVAGGDICTSTRLRLSDGSSALIKTRPNAPADFFAVETDAPLLAPQGQRGTRPDRLECQCDLERRDRVGGVRAEVPADHDLASRAAPHSPGGKAFWSGGGAGTSAPGSGMPSATSS